MQWQATSSVSVFTFLWGLIFISLILSFIKHKSRHSSDILAIPMIQCCYTSQRNMWDSYLALCCHLVVSWSFIASLDQFLMRRWYPGSVAFLVLPHSLSGDLKLAFLPPGGWGKHHCCVIKHALRVFWIFGILHYSVFDSQFAVLKLPFLESLYPQLTCLAWEGEGEDMSQRLIWFSVWMSFGEWHFCPTGRALSQVEPVWSAMATSWGPWVGCNSFSAVY